MYRDAYGGVEGGLQLAVCSIHADRFFGSSCAMYMNDTAAVSQSADGNMRNGVFMLWTGCVSVE